MRPAVTHVLAIAVTHLLANVLPMSWPFVLPMSWHRTGASPHQSLLTQHFMPGYPRFIPSEQTHLRPYVDAHASGRETREAMFKRLRSSSAQVGVRVCTGRLISRTRRRAPRQLR